MKRPRSWNKNAKNLVKCIDRAVLSMSDYLALSVKCKDCPGNFNDPDDMNDIFGVIDKLLGKKKTIIDSFGDQH